MYIAKSERGEIFEFLFWTGNFEILAESRLQFCHSFFFIIKQYCNTDLKQIPFRINILYQIEYGYQLILLSQVGIITLLGYRCNSTLPLHEI